MWGEGFTHAVYTKNRMPSATVNYRSPYETLTAQMPDLRHLQPFGSPAHILVPEERRRTQRKLLAHSIEGFLVGYGEQRNHYLFSIPSVHRVVLSLDIKPRVVTFVPEVITIATCPVSPGVSSNTPTILDPSASNLPPNTASSSGMSTAVAEVHDLYPNLFKSCEPESSAPESANLPRIIPSTPACVRLSAAETFPG